MKLRGALFGVLALALSATACGPKTESKAPLPPYLPAKPLHLSPLTDLVAAGGLEWMVVLRPAEILRDPVLRPAIQKVLPDEGLGRLEATMGFDVRKADAAVAAGFGPSTLYLASVPHDGPRVVKLFSDRLSSAQRRSEDGHRLVRVDGKIGDHKRSLADFEETVVGIETGPGLPLKAAVAFSEEKLKKAKPALAAPPLDALWKHVGAAPIVVVAPRSMHDGWKDGAHGVLERALAVGLAATPTARGVSVKLVVLGPFDDQAAEAAKRVALTLADLEKAPIGRLLGIDQPLSATDLVTAEKDVVTLTREISADKLAAGLWAATTAEMKDLFGKPGAKP